MARSTKSAWIDISVPLYTGMVHWPGDPNYQATLAKSTDAGDVCNVTQLATSAHIGTHMDAPRHFIPGGLAMDQLPLDAVLGPCRVIEIKDKEAIRPAELVPQKLKAGERILFKTRNSRRAWKTSEFFKEFVYVAKEAAAYLVERGIQTIGVDYLSVGGFFKDGVETHHILLGARVWVIEGLNLSGVKPGRYELACLPLKMRGSDGAPARAVIRPL
jgi:arylformamidase